MQLSKCSCGVWLDFIFTVIALDLIIDLVLGYEAPVPFPVGREEIFDQFKGRIPNQYREELELLLVCSNHLQCFTRYIIWCRTAKSPNRLIANNRDFRQGIEETNHFPGITREYVFWIMQENIQQAFTAPAIRVGHMDI